MRVGARNRGYLLFITTFLYAAIARSQTSELQPTQARRIKLEGYGWQAFSEPGTGQQNEWPGARPKSIWIDHSGRVIVGFTARETVGLATRGHHGLSFHILRFTPEGKVDFSLVLPTDNWFSNGVYLDAHDRILARADGLFQALLPKNEDKEWKSLMPCAAGCFVGQAKSRQTFVIQSGTLGKFTYTVIDASVSPPRLVESCTQNDMHASRITDKFSYWTHAGNGGPTVRRSPICGLSQSEDLPLQLDGAIPLNDSTFLRLDTEYKSSRGAIELLDSGGKVRFRHEFPKHDSPVRYTSVSSDDAEDRFAFVVGTWRGGSYVLDISARLAARRVVVYSENGSELASLPVSATYHRDFDFALSPDGRRLAILEEGTVTLANLE